MAYVKLDCGILKSTLWDDREAREVFITALLMAEPRAIEKDSIQLEVRTLNPTGWAAPPGRYGFVDAAGVGIVRQAGIDREAGLAALERLGSPEAGSRSQAHEGRRLIRVDGGYVVLNYAEYRDKDHTATERMRRFRERKKAGCNAVASRQNAVTGRLVTDSREHRAEADTEREPRTLSAFDLSECPKDMDTEKEQKACDAYHAGKGGITQARWRSWVLAAKASGRYAKASPRRPTDEECRAERNRIAAAQS